MIPAHPFASPQRSQRWPTTTSDGPGEVQHAIVVLVTVLSLIRYFRIIWNCCPPGFAPASGAWKVWIPRIMLLKGAIGNPPPKIIYHRFGIQIKHFHPFWIKQQVPKNGISCIVLSVKFLRCDERFSKTILLITCNSAWTSISQAFRGATTQRVFQAWCWLEGMCPNVSTCFPLELPITQAFCFFNPSQAWAKASMSSNFANVRNENESWPIAGVGFGKELLPVLVGTWLNGFHFLWVDCRTLHFFSGQHV